MSYSAALSSSVIQSPFPSVFYRRITATNDHVITILYIGEGLEVREPLLVPIEYEDGYYTADLNIKGLVVSSAEKTKKELTKDLSAQLLHAWDYYAMETDQNLTQKAREVKEWLLSHIRSR